MKQRIKKIKTLLKQSKKPHQRDRLRYLLKQCYEIKRNMPSV